MYFGETKSRDRQFKSCRDFVQLALRLESKGAIVERDNRKLRIMAQQPASEIGSVLTRVPPDASDLTCAEILKAHRIACYGVGREGSIMKALVFV